MQELVALNRVNDYEIGSKRQEIKNLRAEIERQLTFRSKDSKVVKDLREELKQVKGEYTKLCNNVRTNFAF